MAADQVAVVLAALTGLLLPRTPRADLARLRHAGAPPSNRSAGADQPAPAGDRSVLAGRGLPAWSPRALGIATGMAVLSGHRTLAVVGVVATVALAAPALAARAARQRDEAAASRELPRVADLLAACLEAGLPLTVAVGEVRSVVDPPTARRLRRLVVGLETGLPGGPGRGAAHGITHGAGTDAWQRFGRAVDRALVRGAPLAEVLVGLADDERERARWAAEEAARRVGVRAVGPLAACFLPAFVLVGVVPVVVGVAGSVLGDLR